MGRRVLVEKAEFEKAVGLRGAFSDSVISILKFILSVILLPLVIGISKGFLLKLFKQPAFIWNNFIFATGLYLVLHLFVCEPKNIYDFGQRIIGSLFNFFLPLRRIMYYWLPFYAVAFFILFLIFEVVFGYSDIIGYFIFLISFSSAMHLLVTSGYLKTESLSPIKGDYFLSLVLVYLFGITLFCGFLSVMGRNFSFAEPIKYGYKFFIEFHTTIWRQFFVVR